MGKIYFYKNSVLERNLKLKDFFSGVSYRCFIVAFLLSFTAASFAEEKAHERRIRLSAELINKMANESDASGLADVIASGRGVAIFPAVTKAGFVLGGQGRAFDRDGLHLVDECADRRGGRDLFQCGFRHVCLPPTRCVNYIVQSVGFQQTPSDYDLSHS